jgi:hypothetical protein
METVLTEVGQKGTLPGLVFRAVRDIIPGEELSVPYYHPADYVSRFRPCTSPLFLSHSLLEQGASHPGD